MITPTIRKWKKTVSLIEDNGEKVEIRKLFEKTISELQSLLSVINSGLETESKTEANDNKS